MIYNNLTEIQDELDVICATALYLYTKEDKSYPHEKIVFDKLFELIEKIDGIMSELEGKQECVKCHKSGKGGYFRENGFICEKCTEEELEF